MSAMKRVPLEKSGAGFGNPIWVDLGIWLFSLLVHTSHVGHRDENRKQSRS